MLYSRLLICLGVVASASAATLTTLTRKDYDNFVYLIRHGEKPDDDSNGLSAQGEERAQCLVNVFSASSGFDIGYILAETPKSSGARERPLETVTPLANSLGLKVDTSCDRDDPDCVADAVADFAKKSDKSVLICWEHDALTDIVKSLGVSKKKAPDYPDDSFDIIWTLQDETILDDTQSENCPGLDD